MDTFIEKVGIVETAKAIDLSVYKYLEYILLYMPETDYKKYPECLNEFLPWSPEVQKFCKNKQANS